VQDKELAGIKDRGVPRDGHHRLDHDPGEGPVAGAQEQPAGTVESGRRAARVIEPGVRVIPQHKPVWLRAISAVDNACFTVGAPHILDLFLIGCAGAVTLLAFR
jgi:hypothetical protein